MMKLKALALIASVALPFGFGSAPASAQQATCPQYTAAGTIIHGQFKDMMAGTVTPEAAVVKIVAELKGLNPNPADAKDIADAVGQLKAAGFPRDAVAGVLKAKLEPTFRTRATAAGCTLPPLPQG